jgi:hypothetical protein
MYSNFKEHKDPFNDIFLNNSLNKNKSTMTLEMMKRLKSKNNLYFLAISPKKIDFYSKTHFIKTFSIDLPNFKEKKMKNINFAEDRIMKPFEKQKLEKEIDEAEELIEHMEHYQKVKNNEKFLECLFTKNGKFATYHESLPNYMFFLVYNCFDIFLSQKYKDLLDEKKDHKDHSLNDIKKDIQQIRHNLYNQVKIVSLEISSNQFISVDSLINIENTIENYGKIQMFKNFKDYIIIVYRSFNSNKIFFNIRIVIKKFDKYSGFKTILNKQLYFHECETPFYDILYKYKKNYKQKSSKKTINTGLFKNIYKEEGK